MAIKSFEILADEKKVQRFIKKDSLWDTIEVNITYANDGVEISQVAYMTARSLQIFLLEREFEAAGYDMAKIEQFGELRYAEGDDNGYDTGYAAGDMSSTDDY